MNSSVKAAPAEKPTPCLARQPILDKDEKVLGYELLFREHPEDNRFNSDYEVGTRSIIDTLNIMGLDVVCDGRLAFINCTQEMLLKKFSFCYLRRRSSLRFRRACGRTKK